MKKILLSLIVLMFALTFVACDKTTTSLTTINTTYLETTNTLDLGTPVVDKYSFKQLDENVMPIGAWADPPLPNFAGIYDNPDLVTNEQYELINQAGINVMYGLYNNVVLEFNYVKKALQHAENNDVVYVVRDSQVVGLYEEEDYSDLTRALDKYKDYPAFGGVMIQDEPGIQSYRNLGLLNESFKRYLPDDVFYVNLLPTYASTNQLINGAAGGTLNDDTFTYESYITRYIDEVNPRFISYDFYPLEGMQYGDLKEGYFEQMSIMRNQGLDNNIPFWVFIQSCTFAYNHLRIPNQAEVNWQVSTALAYGAKGIQYFTYYTPMEGNGNFVGGMVDKEGNINPMYYYVQEANEHIALVDSILMNSRHMGVIQHGDSPAEIPSEDKLETFSVLESIVGDDALIGCFNYQGKPAYYVVNNSFATKDAVISLGFSQSVSYSAYQGTDTVEATGTDINLTIPTGEGVLIVLN